MKLTDIMFNLEYVAANVGGTIVKGSDVFFDEEVAADSSGEITLKKTAVALTSGGAVTAWVRKANAKDDKRTKKVVDSSNKITGLEAEELYCVRYRATDSSAEELVVSSQFIPDTLHAVLTVALYAGDDKNPENGTKVGEVTIEIPRFQLSGAMELSMTAAGASQTSLEGSALASGAKGCNGKGIYAKIIKVIYNSHWYDDASGLIIEDNYIEMDSSEFKPFTPTVFAWYASAAPKQISNAILKAQNDTSKLVFSVVDAGNTNLQIDGTSGQITASSSASSGTALFKVVAQDSESNPIPGLDASLTIKFTA